MPKTIDFFEARGRGTQSPQFKRVLHDAERRYLAPDAQAKIYRYLATEEVPLEVTERAIVEAVSLARLKNTAADVLLFDFLVSALLDGCSFEIPEAASDRLFPSSCTLC